VNNIQAVKKGSDEIIVIGAHYDSLPGTPGADDNAAGIAVLLELATLTADMNLNKTVYFVAFSTEEPPFFKSKEMGSYVYAKNLHEAGDHIFGMISLEMLGYYSDQPFSQAYPWWYGLGRPKQGNFIGVVSDFGSRTWKKRVAQSLSQATDLPVESLWMFRMVPGTDWSDNWSFWQFGYPALMITDSGPYRNPYYHRSTDTYEKLDYGKMAQLTEGLAGMVRGLAE